MLHPLPDFPPQNLPQIVVLPSLLPLSLHPLLLRRAGQQVEASAKQDGSRGGRDAVKDGSSRAGGTASGGGRGVVWLPWRVGRRGRWRLPRRAGRQAEESAEYVGSCEGWDAVADGSSSDRQDGKRRRPERTMASAVDGTTWQTHGSGWDSKQRRPPAAVHNGSRGGWDSGRRRPWQTAAPEVVGSGRYAAVGPPADGTPDAGGPATSPPPPPPPLTVAPTPALVNGALTPQVERVSCAFGVEGWQWTPPGHGARRRSFWPSRSDDGQPSPPMDDGGGERLSANGQPVPSRAKIYLLSAMIPTRHRLSSTDHNWRSY